MPRRRRGLQVAARRAGVALALACASCAAQRSPVATPVEPPASFRRAAIRILACDGAGGIARSERLGGLNPQLAGSVTFASLRALAGDGCRVFVWTAPPDQAQRFEGNDAFPTPSDPGHVFKLFASEPLGPPPCVCRPMDRVPLGEFALPETAAAR